MRKKLLLSALLCCSMLTTLSATTVTIDDFIIEGVTPNAYLDNSTDPEHRNSVCMGTGDTLIVSINDKFFYDGGLIYYSWATAGSVAIADTISNNSVRVVSNGYGKGRVYFRYRTGDCSTFMAFDIFKSFSAKDFNISGPDCMTPGDVVVLSVLPVLTEHLSDQIGIDRYYWNVTATPKPAFVDRIIYAAGDGSAVTFVAGNVSDSDYVSVNFGVCNQASDRAARRKLGRTAPKPDVPDEVCAVYGLQTITLSVNEPVDGVEYLWWCKNAKWQFDQTVGTSVSVTLDAESSEDIVVTASYVDGSGCSGTETSIKVNRSWGTDVALTSPSSTSYQFTTGSTYEFRLTGQLSSGSIEWLCPQGWSIAPTSSQGYVNIKLIPGANALLQDTLRARTHSCSESGYDVVEHVVYVHPAPVTAISGETCLTAGQQYVFRVAAEGNGPKAASYTWKINNNTASYAAFTGDSIVFTATEGMTSISVRPNGLNGCNGSFYTQNLLFKPTAPTGIVFDADLCIAYNMPDTITCNVQTPIANQNYAWIVPSNWSILATRNNGQEVDIRTTGIAGTYTIGVYGISNGVCGNTDTINTQVQINDLTTYIEYDAESGVYTAKPARFSGTDFRWYLVHNGVVVNDKVFEGQGNRMTMILDPYFELIGDPANSTEYTVVMEYITGMGCNARITYGAPLASTFEPQQSLGSYNSSRIQRRDNDLTNNSLQLSPNPTSSILNITMLNEDNFSLRIFNMEGMLIFANDANLTHYTIDVSAYPSGEYIVMGLYKGKRLSSKFIKQ